jgi:hypothetical protein
VLHFNVGEVVERREFSNTTRGTVVHVTANGYVVTVQWYGWLSLEGRESTLQSSAQIRPSCQWCHSESRIRRRPARKPGPCHNAIVRSRGRLPSWIRCRMSCRTACGSIHSPITYRRVRSISFSSTDNR